MLSEATKSGGRCPRVIRRALSSRILTRVDTPRVYAPFEGFRLVEQVLILGAPHDVASSTHPTPRPARHPRTHNPILVPGAALLLLSIDESGVSRSERSRRSRVASRRSNVTSRGDEERTSRENARRLVAPTRLPCARRLEKVSRAVVGQVVKLRDFRKIQCFGFTLPHLSSLGKK